MNFELKAMAMLLVFLTGLLSVMYRVEANVNANRLECLKLGKPALECKLLF